MSTCKRLLTLDDLYSYYSSKSRSSHFNFKDADSPIVVQVEGKLNFENSSDNEGLQAVTLQSCHINKNLNGSNIKKSVMEKALPSFKNRPILGYIHEVNGQFEFYGHNMHLDEDDNIVYDEIPVGIIPESCNARLEYDEDKDKTYCVVDGFIFEEYTKASEILQREKECYVSVELCIREMSYQAKEKYLDIEDFYFSGVTILGKDEYNKEVEPGMAGSNIKLKDFSAESNSMFSHSEINAKLVETLDKLNTTLSQCFNKEDNQKGGTEEMNKFKELLEKYSKTVEDIDFEYENMTDEELEAKFSELFEGEEDTSDSASADEVGDGATETEEGTTETDPIIDDDEAPEDTGTEPESQELEVKEVDKAGLNEVIDSIAGYKEEEYTPDSWSAMQAALTKANEIKDKAEATDQEVKEAKEALEKAIQELTNRANTSELESLIESVASLNQDEYTDETWAEVQKQLDAANKVKDNLNASQDDVTSAKDALDKAIKSLKSKSESSTSDDGNKKKKKYSIHIGEQNFEFEVSLNEKWEALSNLVNITYSEEDNTYYGVDIYESYLVMIDYWNGNAFKQSYKQDGNEFSLVGDRIAVYSNWLTEEEENQLKEMRSNYSVIKEKLNKYEKAEEDAVKEAIFADESYAEYLETEEFKSLMNDKDKYSVDELKEKAELAFAKCVKKTGTFAVRKPSVKVKKHGLFTSETKEEKKPYGNLFD